MLHNTTFFLVSTFTRFYIAFSMRLVFFYFVENSFVHLLQGACWFFYGKIQYTFDIANDKLYKFYTPFSYKHLIRNKFSILFFFKNDSRLVLSLITNNCILIIKFILAMNIFVINKNWKYRFRIHVAALKY